eukprot:comp22692_c0_seq1/m.35153 comp22692_c0_seq1/g.35153  ORF comp22692_c0_seq1/g.35153 comp22692_c0_seq1/m.35153 type:complete len:215 (-) comp22692_c0_seq1:71-715(-)
MYVHQPISVLEKVDFGDHEDDFWTSRKSTHTMLSCFAPFASLLGAFKVEHGISKASPSFSEAGPLYLNGQRKMEASVRGPVNPQAVLCIDDSSTTSLNSMEVGMCPEKRKDEGGCSGKSSSKTTKGAKSCLVKTRNGRQRVSFAAHLTIDCPTYSNIEYDRSAAPTSPLTPYKYRAIMSELYVFKTYEMKQATQEPMGDRKSAFYTNRSARLNL